MMHEKNKRKRIIAAACLLALLAGTTTLTLGLRSYADTKTPSDDSEPSVKETAKKNGSISAGGTVSCKQLSDTLQMGSTSAKLVVESVLAESGDEVTKGTKLYKLTADSVSRAEKTLKNELQSAESSFLQEKVSSITEKNEAYALYQSELLLGETAQSDYEKGLSELDSNLQSAYDSYTDAQNTVNNTPNEINAKQAELANAQAEVNTLQEQKEDIQLSVNEAKEVYTEAVNNYNAAAAEYNAAAGVARYLGNKLGIDTSSITLVQNETADISEPSVENAAENFGDGSVEMPEGFGDVSEMMKGGFQPSGQSPEPPNEQPPTAAIPETAEIQLPQIEENSGLAAEYNATLEELKAQQEILSQASKTMKSAKQEYSDRNSELSECSSSLQTAQSAVSSVEKEISSLNSTLSKAKSNLTKLREEYNSLKKSYETDKLALKKKLDTDLNTFENAQYHYELTLSTIEKEYSEAQQAKDTAEENLRIFEEELADGYICAKQDGVIYSLGAKENRSVSLDSPYVYYVDDTTFTTTVELDQKDITQISIGDSVMIYSSETGITNGKITAITAGTANSLADVRFNVTITADENAALYSGQSVNVYFDSDVTDTIDFADFGGSADNGSDNERKRPDFGGDMPDFGGKMPEGFDFSNMPNFKGRGSKSE